MVREDEAEREGEGRAKQWQRQSQGTRQETTVGAANLAEAQCV